LGKVRALGAAGGVSTFAGRDGTAAGTWLGAGGAPARAVSPPVVGADAVGTESAVDPPALSDPAAGRRSPDRAQAARSTTQAAELIR